MPDKPKKNARRKAEKGEIYLSPGAVVIPNSKKLQRDMERCLARSGEITLTFKEISATKLPTRGALSVVPVSD
jgi:hypothetical protein